MNTMLKTLLAATLFASSTASAETICSNCGQSPYTYLGGHWRGDRSTIIGLTNGVYVLDVYENALLTVAVSGRLLVAIRSAIEDDCGAEIGAACETIISQPMVERAGKLVRKRVVAGRYVIAVDTIDVSGPFSGTITVGPGK